MNLAPIDGRQFAPPPRVPAPNPACCRLPQLIRLTLLAVLGGSLTLLALGARNGHAEAAIVKIMPDQGFPPLMRFR
jgi:hypothetical protein